jgi:hypothetical protein
MDFILIFFLILIAILLITIIAFIIKISIYLKNDVPPCKSTTVPQKSRASSSKEENLD